VIGSAAADYLLRLPAWMRLALLGCGLFGLIAAIRAWVWHAWKFRPSLTEIALRIERTPEGRSAGLGGVLASGLELAQAEPAEEPAARWMSNQVIAEAARRATGFRASSVLRHDPIHRSWLMALLAASAAVGAASAAGNELTRIALARILTPWSGAAWPKRTAIADTTNLKVHPLGTALPLRAVVARTDRSGGQTRVEAKFRLVSDGSPGTVQRALLTGQGRAMAVPGLGPARQGELYERLIEPASLVAPGSIGELEYWFESEDDRTEPSRIRLVYPPAVLASTATITPPAYVGGADHAAGFVSGAADLGPGNDRRAIVAPVLAGSRVTLEVTLSKSVPAPKGHAALAAAFPGAEFGDDFSASFAGISWRLDWTITRPSRVPVVPVDEFGLRGVDEAAYTFEVAEDRAPAAAITEPAQDEAVLATAVVDVTAEGRDDVAVASVTVEGRAARRAAGSLGAAPEPAGEPHVISRAEPDPGSPPTRLTVSARVSPADYSLNPGDELWLNAVATDAFELNGSRHEPTRSTPRKLRIIRPEELVEQVRTELARLRDAAIRLDAEQEDLSRSLTRNTGVTEDERRRQAGLSQRLAQQSAAVARLAERTERNRLNDPSIAGLLDDTHALLDSAQASSEQAAASQERAAQDSREPEGSRTPLTPDETAKIKEAQDRVRENLGQLIEMLDRGQDSWVVRRELQRLLEQQRALQAQTRLTGQRTTGRDAADLAPTERASLDRIAEQQLDLSRQAQQALDQLEERARQLKSVDAAQASAMQEAARRGREQRVPEAMQQASQSAARNQTGSAEQQQQSAVDAMERMLSDLDNAERNRDESLRRLLSSLIESLDGLIRQQQDQLAALTAARDKGDYAGLDAGMLRLNQNTLGVLGEAKTAFRETARVARLIEAAADAQADAVVRLRAVPVAPDSAQAAEQESLRVLQHARAEAQKLEQEARQRDQSRKRQELRKVYREALELQVALRDETAPLLIDNLDRRDRMKLRGLGERQEAVRDMLAQLRQRTAELADAVTFTLAHDQLDSATTGAAKKMRAGQPSRSIAREQGSAVRILQSLVEALSETADQGDEFRDAESGQGGGPSGGQEPPLIPDLAEVRLLRGLQVQAGELTRALDGSTDASVAAELQALADLQRQLAERGSDLIKKMQRPGTPPAPPGNNP
jgi:hypothetical protein